MWVAAETREGTLAQVSTELLTKAVELASTLDTGVAALLLGHRLDTAAKEAAQFGADLVIMGDDERFASRLGMPAAQLVAAEVEKRQPDVLLFGATTTGRDLAPRIAATLDTGLAADCTDLYIADWERRDHRYPDLLHQVRPAMAGGVLATCLCPESRPQMATVRPGVFVAREHPRSLQIEPFSLDLQPEDFDVEVLERTLQRSDVALVDAEVIVAGGAGCDAQNWHLIEALADRLEGRVAASRAAVEAGLAPRPLQVGQTGTTVHPRLYIACGISGALQHVVGMRGSQTIVAVNRDADAAIFRFADYGVVGDVAQVIPELIAALARDTARS